MENFYTKETKSTPAILFNGNKGILNIAGKSLPEDSISFYRQLSDSINDLALNNPNVILNITCELEYVNTSSSMILLNILQKARYSLNKILVTWSYEEDDEDIHELGKIFEENLNIKFEYRQFVTDARFV